MGYTYPQEVPIPSPYQILRTLLRRPSKVDPAAHRQQNATHPSVPVRVLSRVAAIVFPTNSSGNNRSVR